MIVIRPLEPIKKATKTMDPLDIGQVPLGQRRPVDFVPDEAIDLRDGVNYAGVTIVDGDSTASVAPGSTNKAFRIFFNGDGGVGPKRALVAVDGHVGDGDVEVTQEITWEVTSPDATAFVATPAPLEPIPTTPPVEPPVEPPVAAARR